MKVLCCVAVYFSVPLKGATINVIDNFVNFFTVIGTLEVRCSK